MYSTFRTKLAAWTVYLMVALLVLMMYSWSVLMVAGNPAKFGKAGRVAFGIAWFPTTVVEAWREAVSIVSGAEKTRYLSVPRPNFDPEGFRAVELPAGEQLSELIVRGDVAAADRGWRLLAGVMELDGSPGAVAVLLAPDLSVRQIWKLDEDEVEVANKASPAHRVLHGFQILPDGSVAFAFDDGSALQRRDFCDRAMWIQPGQLHHSIDLTEDGRYIWTLREGGFARPGASAGPENPPNTGAVKLDLRTGEILQEIGVADLIDANPGLGIFELGRRDESAVETNIPGVQGFWPHDPVHFNDADPLPQSLASAFPQFQAGDLLLSARNLNTIVVVDPDTLRIKWHHTGGMMRQHDPDWQPDGTISVYDNAMGMGASRIVSISPQTNQVRVTFAGSQTGFYSRIRGKHMRSDRGDLILSSPQQGRALEVGPDGQPVLEFFNLKPGTDDQNFVLTEYLWISENALNLDEKTCSNI